MRSAADFDTPNSGASCRRVRFVRQYAATSRTRSSSGRPQGRPLRTGSAPSRRSAVMSLPNCRGLSPVNGAIQDGSDAVITPATARSFHSWPAVTGQRLEKLKRENAELRRHCRHLESRLEIYATALNQLALEHAALSGRDADAAKIRTLPRRRQASP